MTWRWCLSQPLHAISIMISPNWMMGKLKPESPIFNGKNHCFRLTDPMMFNRASSGHVFLHHRTIFGHKHPGGSWDLRIILLQKKSWTIHLTHSIWNMQRENSLYIYMYIHVLNRKNNDFSIADFGWCCWFHPPKSMSHVMEKNSEMRTVQGAVDFQGSETTRICRHVEPQIVLAWLAARGSRMEWGSMGISWWGVTGITTWLWCRFSSFKGQRDVKFHRKFGMSETTKCMWK